MKVLLVAVASLSVVSVASSPAHLGQSSERALQVNGGRIEERLMALAQFGKMLKAESDS